MGENMNDASFAKKMLEAQFADDKQEENYSNFCKSLRNATDGLCINTSAKSIIVVKSVIEANIPHPVNGSIMTNPRDIIGAVGAALEFYMDKTISTNKIIQAFDSDTIAIVNNSINKACENIQILTEVQRLYTDYVRICTSPSVADIFSILNSSNLTYREKDATLCHMEVTCDALEQDVICRTMHEYNRKIAEESKRMWVLDAELVNDFVIHDTIFDEIIETIRAYRGVVARLSQQLDCLTEKGDGQ